MKKRVEGEELHYLMKKLNYMIAEGGKMPSIKLKT